MSRPSAMGVTLALVAAMALLPRLAGGQPEPPGADAVAQAEQLFHEGVVATERADFAAALRLFRESYALNPVPDVLYNIGMCHKALGELPAAANAFRDYVATAGTLAPEEQAEFDVLLAELVPRIGRIDVHVSEPGAAVEMDGAPVGTSPLAGWHAVAPGRHEVLVRKGGFEPSRTVVEVAAGETASVQALLVAVAAPPPGPGSEPSPVPQPEPEGLSPWFWTCVGVAGVSALTMAVTGGLTLKYIDDFDAGGRTDADLRDTAVTLRTTTDVFLGLTLAAVAAGTVLLVLELSGDDEQPTGRTGATAVLSPAGLVVTW